MKQNRNTDWLDHPLTTVVMWIVIIAVCYSGLLLYGKYDSARREAREADPAYQACKAEVSVKNDEFYSNKDEYEANPYGAWECNSDNQPVFSDNTPDYCDVNRC